MTWDQLRAILAMASRRDRLLLMLDMTDALRPSELFALRWLSFDDENTLSLTENRLPPATRAVWEDTEKSWRSPFSRWPRRRSPAVGTGVPRSLSESVHALERGRRSARSKKLSQQGPQTSCRGLGHSQADFPGAPPHDGDAGTEPGSVKNIQAYLRHSRAGATANEYMQELPESVQQMVGSVYAMLTSSKAPQRVI